VPVMTQLGCNEGALRRVCRPDQSPADNTACVLDTFADFGFSPWLTSLKYTRRDAQHRGRENQAGSCRTRSCQSRALHKLSEIPDLHRSLTKWGV